MAQSNAGEDRRSPDFARAEATVVCLVKARRASLNLLVYIPKGRKKSKTT